MYPEPLSRAEILQAAIELKRLPEFKERALQELMPQACRLLLQAGEIGAIEDRAYRNKITQEQIAGSKKLTEEEAAKFVIGDKDHPKRALETFRRLLGLDLDAVDRYCIQHGLGRGDNVLWALAGLGGDVLALQSLFPSLAWVGNPGLELSLKKVEDDIELLFAALERFEAGVGSDK